MTISRKFDPIKLGTQALQSRTSEGQLRSKASSEDRMVAGSGGRPAARPLPNRASHLFAGLARPSGGGGSDEIDKINEEKARRNREEAADHKDFSDREFALGHAYDSASDRLKELKGLPSADEQAINAKGQQVAEQTGFIDRCLGSLKEVRQGRKYHSSQVTDQISSRERQCMNLVNQVAAQKARHESQRAVDALKDSIAALKDSQDTLNAALTKSGQNIEELTAQLTTAQNSAKEAETQVNSLTNDQDRLEKEHAEDRQRAKDEQDRLKALLRAAQEGARERSSRDASSFNSSSLTLHNLASRARREPSEDAKTVASFVLSAFTLREARENFGDSKVDAQMGQRLASFLCDSPLLAGFPTVVETFEAGRAALQRGDSFDSKRDNSIRGLRFIAQHLASVLCSLASEEAGAAHAERRFGDLLAQRCQSGVARLVDAVIQARNTLPEGDEEAAEENAARDF